MIAAGPQAKRVKVGDRVGLGWNSGSCLSCAPCLSGDHNMCVKGEATIIGRHGGFADRVRSHWLWPAVRCCAAASRCSNPIVQFDRATDRVGVVGIGGLGQLALRFLNKWGCDVTAFTSSDSKADEAKKLGAHHVINSRDSGALTKAAGSFDLLLVTANASLDWNALLGALAPRGRLHIVGAVPEPIPVGVFSLLMGQKSVSSSPSGAPGVVDKMLEFCARHEIAPMVEEFPMSKINDALEHLKAGKARYRVVLKNDF